MTLKNLLLAAVAVGLLTAGAIYVFVYNKPHTNVARAEAVFDDTAEALYTAFEARPDEAAAWVDRVVRVHGTVSEVNASGERATLVLEAGNPMGGGLSAAMDPEADVSGVSAGDRVVLKGICSGLQADEGGLLGALGATVQLTASLLETP